eukprot:6452672-Alexandrium_andersonii.AAC.1
MGGAELHVSAIIGSCSTCHRGMDQEHALGRETAEHLVGTRPFSVSQEGLAPCIAVLVTGGD